MRKHNASLHDSFERIMGREGQGSFGARVGSKPEAAGGRAARRAAGEGAIYDCANAGAGFAA
jgi:hypothetical protein